MPPSTKLLPVEVVAGVVSVAIVVELDEAVAVLEGDLPEFAVPERKERGLIKICALE